MSTVPNLKKSNSNNISSRSQSSSFSSRKRSNDDLTQKMRAKDQEIAELTLKIQENERTAQQQRQQNEDLKQQLGNVKFQYDEKSEELERFRYTNHLHRKKLMVQQRENLESLQGIIERKDKEIELLKSRLHTIIRSKYTECEDLRYQLEMLKRQLNQINSLNVNISDQIKVVKKKSVAFSQPEVVANPTGRNSDKSLAVALSEKLGKLIDNQDVTEKVALEAQSNSPIDTAHVSFPNAGDAEEETINLQSSGSIDTKQTSSTSKLAVTTISFPNAVDAEEESTKIQSSSSINKMPATSISKLAVTVKSFSNAVDAEEESTKTQSSSSIETTQPRSISKLGVKAQSYPDASKCNLLVLDSLDSVHREDSNGSAIKISGDITSVISSDELEKDN